jgi:predicted RNA-binding Zn ribbon-like protein
MEELWIDFINSEWHDWRGSGASEDRLDKPGWLDAWLAQRGLPPFVPDDEARRAELKRLRTELRACAERLAQGGELDEGVIAGMNERLRRAPVTKRLVRDESGKLALTESLDAKADGGDVLLASVVLSFVRTIAGGRADRVRICGNRDCQWVFLDDTRNRSKRYCDDSMCGNLMKVRRFRERRKTAPSAAAADGAE